MKEDFAASYAAVPSPEPYDDTKRDVNWKHTYNSSLRLNIHDTATEGRKGGRGKI